MYAEAFCDRRAKLSGMSTDPRIAAASSFLLQSPPGEINDILNGSIRYFCI